MVLKVWLTWYMRREKKNVEMYVIIFQMCFPLQLSCIKESILF